MGSATSQKRNDACRGMLDYGFANFAHYTPECPADAAVPVKLGTAETVNAVLRESGPLLVKKAELSQITARHTLLPEIDAPVEPGDTLGELTVACGDEVLAVVPLIAGEAVEKLTWQELFARLLGRVAMGKCS
jgi:D-alanyl-D-alanine carboxypeptidase (penicillin-binding protein 5/6)